MWLRVCGSAAIVIQMVSASLPRLPLLLSRLSANRRATLQQSKLWFFWASETGTGGPEWTPAIGQWRPLIPVMCTIPVICTVHLTEPPARRCFLSQVNWSTLKAAHTFWLFSLLAWFSRDQLIPNLTQSLVLVVQCVRRKLALVRPLIRKHL